MRLIVLVAIFAASVLAGPKIFVPIEAPKPSVCQRVCQVCGRCVPKPFGRGRTSFRNDEQGYSIYACSSDHGDTTRSFNIYDRDSCDSVVWGRMREICRIDTIGTGVIRYCVWGKPAVRMALMVWLGDTMPTRRVPFMATPDARGISTFYLRKGQYEIVRIADKGVADRPDTVTVGGDYPDYRIDTVYCEDTVPPSAPRTPMVQRDSI